MEDVLNEVGLRPMEGCICRWRNTIVDWVAMRASFAHCVRAERLKLSSHQDAYWWEQEVDLDLDPATWPYGSDGPDS